MRGFRVREPDASSPSAASVFKTSPDDPMKYACSALFLPALCVGRKKFCVPMLISCFCLRTGRAKHALFAGRGAGFRAPPTPSLSPSFKVRHYRMTQARTVFTFMTFTFFSSFTHRFFFYEHANWGGGILGRHTSAGVGTSRWQRRHLKLGGVGVNLHVHITWD